ncbi:hypothetical protein ACA910_000176 [Epithemia clementina (nom. ined.)]
MDRTDYNHDVAGRLSAEDEMMLGSPYGTPERKTERIADPTHVLRSESLRRSTASEKADAGEVGFKTILMPKRFEL